MNWSLFIFKDKHIFLLDKNVSRVKELNNTFTMLSSEDDRICSSSVWEETSFWLNKKTVNKIIIILLKRCIFSYWTITCPCHVSQNFKNTLTMLLSGVDRICTSSVWEETAFCWKKKDRKWIDNHSFKTSTFSYWTRMCHVSHSFKIYFYDVIVGGGQSALVFCRTEEEHILSPLAPDVFLLKQNDRTLNQFMSMSIQMGFFFVARSQKCTEHLFYIERLWSFYLTKISYFKLFFLVMLVCYICTCNHCLPRLAHCLTVNTSFYKEKFSFKASMFQLV